MIDGRNRNSVPGAPRAGRAAGILDKQMAAKRSEIAGIAGQQAAKEAQLASLRTELDGLTDLLSKGMVEKTSIATSSARFRASKENRRSMYRI